MTKKTKHIVITVSAVAVALGLFLFGVNRGRKWAENGFIYDKDTVVIYNTIHEIKPTVTSESNLGFKIAPMRLYKFYSDTTTQYIPVKGDTDTVYVYVPMTQRYYERLDGRLRLWISGYEPTLDRWEFDEKEVRINYQKHWSFSVGVGPSVIWSPFNGFDAGLGLFAGVSYNF